MKFDFNHCQELMQKCRSGEYRLPGRRRSTFLFKKDEHTYSVRFHYTDVVDIHDDGSYTLYNGGYHTVSTKERINLYSPACVVQKDFVWYLDGKVFVDGCRVNSQGHLIENFAKYSPRLFG